MDPSQQGPGTAVCPACGQFQRASPQTWDVETPRRTNPWTRCDACGSYSLVGSYSLDEEVAHTEELPWGQLQAGLELNRFKHRMFVTALRTIARHRPPPARVLDVGCSFGGFPIEARAAGYDVCGMDITPAAVEHVQSLGIEAECCPIADELVGVPDGTVDVVTCLDCQSLWPDQPAQLAAVHRKLAPNGILVLRVVDKSWMFAIGRRLVRVSPGLAKRVMREAVNDNRFSMPVHQLRRLLGQQGFTVIDVSIWDALHSDETRWPAKLSFLVGAALWPVTHRNVGPGAVIVARVNGQPSTDG